MESAGDLTLVASSQVGRDRGLGRYEASMRALLAVLIEEGSINVVANADARAWRHALDLDAASGRLRHQITSVLDVIPLDMPAAYTRHGLRARWRYGKAALSEGVITLSQYSAHRLHTHYPRLRDRVHIVPLPVERLVRWHDRPGTYVMTMADYRSPDVRKRLNWIPQAARVLLRSGIETKVVVRGHAPVELRDCGATLLTNVPNEGLHAMMRDCLAFFYPSAYEGQGLPPQEAMAAGAPVIAFDNTSLSEFIPSGFLLPDPIPWTKGATRFEPMPRSTVDALVDRARHYRDVPSNVWRPQNYEALSRLSTHESLKSLRLAYRRIGVIA